MLLTKEQIINYLTETNFTENYVCGDGTACEMLLRRVIPEKVFGQKSLGQNMPGRFWWIEYLSEVNKFVLRCSYFDKDENPITREQFIELMKEVWAEEKINTLPAVMYTPTTEITWEPISPGEWQATYSVPTRTSGCMINGALNKILTKEKASIIPPVQLPQPTPYPTPTPPV